MPGIATQFRVLQLTLDKLAASSNPSLTAIAGVIGDNSPYAHLGALGPAIGDFLPGNPPSPPGPVPNTFTGVWEILLGLLADSAGAPKGLLTTLTNIRAMLDQMQTIVDAEDTAAICALQDTDFTTQLNNTATDLAHIVTDLSNTTNGPVVQIANIIMNHLKPNVDTAAATDPAPDPSTWQMRDYLSWKKPGTFIKALLEVAQETGDDRLRAYAYGYACAYSANVCGNPFINTNIGGTARTQWWRRRFVENYVDAWTHGFYESGATMSGDTPTPPYATTDASGNVISAWPNLCGAKLHLKIQIGPDFDVPGLLNKVKLERPFPDALPADFAAHWFAAFERAYGTGAAAGRFDATSLNATYLMTWLMLWFKTSGDLLQCTPTIPMTPPNACDDAGALDPFTPAPGGGPSLPPAPSIDHSTDTGAVICGILLAIFGGLSILAGNFGGGAAAIAGAVSELSCPHALDVNWDSLRCTLFWYKMYLFNATKGLHQLLMFSGFDYPYGSDLGQDAHTLSLLGLTAEFESAVSLVRSSYGQKFPSKPWDGSILTFNQRPSDANPGFESLSAVGALEQMTGKYPSYFVNDNAANPLSHGDVKTPATTFPFRADAEGQPTRFGNSVANAVDLLAHLSNPPNWNLDGDRGLAYVTWQFHSVYDPDAVNIDPEP